MKKIAFIFVFLICGCALPIENSVKVFLPQIPAQWEGLYPDECWKIEYLNADGETASMQVGAGLEYFYFQAYDWPYLILTASKSDDFLPAGICAVRGSYCYELCWEQGPAASFFLSLNNLSDIFWEYNLIKISSDIIDKTDNDPWSFDFDRLKRAFSFGSVNGSQFKKLPSHTLKLNSDSDILASWDPLYNPEFFPELSCREGKNGFFTGTDIITIYAEPKGWKACILYRTGLIDILFGNW